MTDWNNLRVRCKAPTAYAIFNQQTGGYIHDSMMRLKTFPCKAEAEAYIRLLGLNEFIFIPVGVEEG